VQWFVLRWQLETTFAEVRAKLGVESQRQWSDLAIARTTPCLLALFSCVTLLAADLSIGAANFRFAARLGALVQSLRDGIELAEKIKKRQFKIGPLGGSEATMPELWQAALAA
jgi:hypothetical protein